MKRLLHILLALALMSPVFAAIARQQNTGHYQALLNNSPFTLPPKKETGPVQEAPAALEDWLLGGILPLGDKWFVTLRHKKEKGRTEMLRGDKPSQSGFRIGKVYQDKDPSKTRVQIILKNGRKELLGFDMKALGVAAAKPAAVQKAKPGQTGRPPIPQARGRQSKPRQKPVRRPRPRVNIPQNNR